MATSGEKLIRGWYEVFSVACALAAAFMVWMGIRALFDPYPENAIMATYGPIVAAFAIFSTLAFSARVVVRFWEFQWREQYKRMHPSRRIGNFVVAGFMLLILCLSSYYNVIGISADEARRLEQNAFIQRKHAEFDAVNDVFAVQEDFSAYLSVVYGQISARLQQETAVGSGGPGSVSTKLERLVSDVGGLATSLKVSGNDYDTHRKLAGSALVSITKVANDRISLTEKDSLISALAVSFDAELTAMRRAIRLDPIKQLVSSSKAFDLGVPEAWFTSVQNESFRKHQEQANEYERILKEKVDGIDSARKWASPEPYIALTDAQAVNRRLGEMPFSIAFGMAIDIVPLLLGLLLGYMSVRTSERAKEKKSNTARQKARTENAVAQKKARFSGKVIDLVPRRKGRVPLSATESPERA